jgi:hypothetical protein
VWQDLMSGALDLFEGSTATITVSGRLSFGARRVPDRQGQAGSGREAARRRLDLTVVVVVLWCRNLDVIFIIFEVLCISGERIV